ncbi:RDD domain containing protein [Arcobacter nitrofigilis DSM 7299]|uniref:RDD domain containing protein n=1 Tax=Arcobacter nitrofigilis (strain ATCC 33309 / DSM 7299 / CCUG 15893 / LMG 7604 / NCTC 12251 / CI) TaxID=572480 RepID=D5V1J5_ARCNC|nr:RDD family protein [Arcobacter nitrofigilis]ADG93429.1 RDD domain containing protein [Arcobacter nitrofigilis DSM 7299]
MIDKQTNSDNFELATINSRIIAFIIDDMLITFIILAIFWDTIVNNGSDLTTVLILMNKFVFQVLVLKFVYQTFFVWYYGATLGKIVAKIRVIDYDDFSKISLIQSALRSFGRILSEMFFYIGFIFAFFNEGKQTFHDKISKTLVVNA